MCFSWFVLSDRITIETVWFLWYHITVYIEICFCFQWADWISSCITHVAFAAKSICRNTDSDSSFWAFSTAGERTVALKIIARCSITQTPTGQSKVWWWHARKMVVIYSKRIQIHCFMANFVVYELRSNFGKHEIGLCIKSEKRLQDVQDVWTQHISLSTIRAPTKLQIFLKDRLSQVSVQWGYCLFWMMHTTLSITQLYKSPIRANKMPYCQETPQPIIVPSHTTVIYVLITVTHHFSNIFLVELR